jgi:peroxiredoxin Q/BCP
MDRGAMNEPSPMPQTGDPAPEIDAQATGDGRFLLSARRGRWVVVYFYPRANTPG